MAWSRAAIRTRTRARVAPRSAASTRGLGWGTLPGPAGPDALLVMVALLSERIGAPPRECLRPCEGTEADQGIWTVCSRLGGNTRGRLARMHFPGSGDSVGGQHRLYEVNWWKVAVGFDIVGDKFGGGIRDTTTHHSYFSTSLRTVRAPRKQTRGTPGAEVKAASLLRSMSAGHALKRLRQTRWRSALRVPLAASEPAHVQDRNAPPEGCIPGSPVVAAVRVRRQICVVRHGGCLPAAACAMECRAHLMSARSSGGPHATPAFVPRVAPRSDAVLCAAQNRSIGQAISHSAAQCGSIPP